MELQQSPPYANYIKNLHWNVETVDGINIFIRKFPLVGGFAKIQRIETYPDISKIISVFKKYNVQRLVLEAAATADEHSFQEFAAKLKKHVKLITTPFIPTKTILVDLTPSEEYIFKHFTEAKRRAVRRAEKNDVEVKEIRRATELIRVKNRSGGILGFITTSGVKQMWESFYPDGATTVIAMTKQQELLAGIFLIFWEDTAYYWIAGSTKKGKKLAAPTILVWEAIKIAKNKGMKVFDFLGVWDERYPHDNKDWLGFTKFKEGFGGKELYYPTHKKHEKSYTNTGS